MTREELPDVCRLDRYSFGDDRSMLLERIYEDFPDVSFVQKTQGEVVGYAMATVSNVLCNIGPVVSLGPEPDRSLLESIGTSLEGKECFLVVPSPPDSLLSDRLGLAQGFGVTRMVRGPEPEGDLGTVLAIGALEKG